MPDHRILLQNGVRFLSDTALKRIHDASCRILAEVGARVEHPRLLRSAARGGLSVAADDGVVTFPRPLVERYLEDARERCRRVTAEPGPALDCLPSEISVSLGGGQAFVYDLTADCVRPATKADLEQATVIGDFYPEITSVSNLIYPTDVPGPVGDLHTWDVLLRRTAKFGAATVTNKGSVKFILDMLAVVVGSVAEVQRRQMFRKICFTYSPLTFPRAELEVGFEMLDHGMTMVIGHPFPALGVHTPITTAGALACVNAEALAGLILTMTLEQPAFTPYYSAAMAGTQPSSAMPLAASPEFLLANAGCAELGRFYGLHGPGFYGAGGSDSPIPNFQAGFEMGASMMLGIFCGNNRLPAGTLGPAHEVVCLPKIVLDLDVARYYNQLLRGIDVDDDTMPLDLILKVMAGDGNFLAEQHTARHIRESVWLPQHFLQVKPSVYNERRPEPLQTAQQTVSEILDTHHPQPLSTAQEREIARIVKEAERAKGVR